MNSSEHIEAALYQIEDSVQRIRNRIDRKPSSTTAECEAALSFWNDGIGRGRTDPEFVKTSAHMLAHALKRAVLETGGK